MQVLVMREREKLGYLIFTGIVSCAIAVFGLYVFSQFGTQDIVTEFGAVILCLLLGALGFLSLIRGILMSAAATEREKILGKFEKIDPKDLRLWFTPGVTYRVYPAPIAMPNSDSRAYNVQDVETGEAWAIIVSSDVVLPNDKHAYRFYQVGTEYQFVPTPDPEKPEDDDPILEHLGEDAGHTSGPLSGHAS